MAAVEAPPLPPAKPARRAPPSKAIGEGAASPKPNPGDSKEGQAFCKTPLIEGESAF